MTAVTNTNDEARQFDERKAALLDQMKDTSRVADALYYDIRRSHIATRDNDCRIFEYVCPDLRSLILWLDFMINPPPENPRGVDCADSVRKSQAKAAS